MLQIAELRSCSLSDCTNTSVCTSFLLCGVIGLFILNLENQERKELAKAFEEASEYLYTSMFNAFEGLCRRSSF